MNSELVNSFNHATSLSILPVSNLTRNSSEVLMPEFDHVLLSEINRQKGFLLAPAIFYTVLAMFVGTVGNPLAIYIYGWKWPKTTTRWFLLWLACVDLLNCLITMPTEIYLLTSFYYVPNGNFCRMARFFTYVINNSTSVVFVAIAIDRYIRICHPHRSPLSISGAKIACIISLVIGVAVSWPAFFLYGRKVVRLPNASIEPGYFWGVMCSIRNDMDKTPYPFAFFIYLCCGVSGCFLILSVLYVLIGRVILKRRRARERRRQVTLNEHTVLHREQTASERNSPEEREGMTPDMATISPDHQSGDVSCLGTSLRGNGCTDFTPMKWGSKRMRPPKSTLMLFAITAVFMMSFMPFLIITIVRQHVGSSFYPSLTRVQEVLVNIFSRSYLVNNCANPVVYGLCNSQFRNEIRKVFCVNRPRRNSSLSRKESNGSGSHLSGDMYD